MIEPTLDLASFAFDEEVDSVMLLLKDGEQSVLKVCRFLLPAAWNGYRFAFTWSRAVLDEMLDVVVVDVVCGPR